MDIQDINKIFTTDFNLDGIACPRRNWDADSRYNYIDNPRRRNGLMLVTDHPVLFNMADGSALRATAGDLILLPKGTRYTVQFLVPPEEQTHPVVLNFRLTAADGPEIFMGSQVIRLCRDDGSLLPLFKSVTKLYENGTTANLKAKVYELFGKLNRERFNLYITHRLGAARIMDEILVLDDGQIIEQGSHERLMQIENGLYRKMFESQSEWYQ